MDSYKEYMNSSPNIKTIVNWYDLYKGHYVNLDKNFQKRLFQEAVKKAGNFSKLGNILNINRKIISSCTKGFTKPTISYIEKIAGYVNFSLDRINNNIIDISNLRPNLPFNLHNIEGAEIRAAFLSDGHIDKKPIARSGYYAYEKKLHSRLVYLCKKIFGDFKSKTYFDGTTYVTKFPSIIGNSLELSGVPHGNKGISNCYLPKDILLGKKKIKYSYLRRVFDDEGDVCWDKSGKRAVRISRSVSIQEIPEFKNISSEKWIRFNLAKPEKTIPNLLLGEQTLLLHLGIDAKLYFEGIYKNKKGNFTAKWRIQIAQQDQLKKFAQLINFNLKEKRDKLNNIINSYTYRKLQNGKGKEKVLEFIKQICKNKGYVSYSDLGKELMNKGFTLDLSGYYLSYFTKEGIIEKTDRGIYILK